MYVYGDFQNGVYIKRGTSASDAIDEYCTSLQEFDESLQDKWGYLKEAGCSKRNNRVELITDDGQILVTTELWYDSRSFLRYIYDIACSRIPPPLACPEILSNYTWRIVNCVRYTYIGMPPGLIEMLIGGPETYFDKQMFCGSVLGLEACLYDAVTDACNTPMRTRHDLIGMMGELYTHAQSVLAMAQCNGTVATPHTHTGKSI